LSAKPRHKTQAYRYAAGLAPGNEPEEPPGFTRRPEPGKAGTASHDKTTRLSRIPKGPYSIFKYTLYIYFFVIFVINLKKT
jgi:hypothetical protein